MKRGDVATRLEQCLEENGVSVRALAKALGKDRSHVQKWKRGDTVPDEANARLLADYFNKPPNYFVTPKERRPTQAERIAALEETVANLEQAIQRPRRQRPRKG